MIRTRQHCQVHFCPNFRTPGRSHCAEHGEQAASPELPYAHVPGPLFAAGVLNGAGSWTLALERIRALPKEEAMELWEALAAGAEALTALIDAPSAEVEG